ncbi:MAG: class I SAM-dependent methyltransferase [Deltaproteobacteria bacterium]|nr:class I SAM-dependent methyltransferase [Deltaproteobacteria bacterium]
MAAHNALWLLARADWREFIFRLQVRLGKIDLKPCSLEELNLSEERSYYYADSGGLHLEEILKECDITSRDAIVDFGSGKGGALFTFSKYPFRKITGCELSPELVAIARKNLDVVRVRNVTFVTGDAAQFEELDEYNYFYFFNPFPCSVMSAVISNIAISLGRRPRRATIIYCNPECHDAVVLEGPFVKVKEYDLCQLKYYVYSNFR